MCTARLGLRLGLCRLCTVESSCRESLAPRSRLMFLVLLVELFVSDSVCTVVCGVKLQGATRSRLMSLVLLVELFVGDSVCTVVGGVKLQRREPLAPA